MGIFKKKNQQTEAENTGIDFKQRILEALNAKLNGTLYDGCIIMPKGYTIDVQVGKKERQDIENKESGKTDIVITAQAFFIVSNDNLLDEPMIEPIDAQGAAETEDEAEAKAAEMAADVFDASLWKPIEQAELKKNPRHISVNYLLQHYDFDLYAQSVVRMGPVDRQPQMLINFIIADLAKYLGSKKCYWIRIFMAKIKDQQMAEVRINGTVCTELAQRLKPYMDTWEPTDVFVSEKQLAVCIQREDDLCPFKKEDVVRTAKRAIELMEVCDSPEKYKELMEELDEVAGDKSIAAEVRVFLPEILAKITLGYGEGDKLFLLQDESSIEFRKTQLRSYFYIQQVCLEYLNSRPEQEKVMNIVCNSVAFKEVKKAKDAGHEPNELYVPGTSYKMNIENYKVW